MPEEGHSKLVILECHNQTVRASVGCSEKEGALLSSSVVIQKLVSLTFYHPDSQCFVRFLLLLSTQLLVMLQ
jgi:hypothetical protein